MFNQLFTAVIVAMSSLSWFVLLNATNDKSISPLTERSESAKVKDGTSLISTSNNKSLK